MSVIPPAGPTPARSYSPPPPYPTPHPMVALDANGLVREEIPCRKCGYTLRGLSPDGRCPECGTAVGLSVHGDLLRYSEPSWVRTLQRGVKLILIGIGVIIVAVIGAALLGGMGMMSMILAAQALSVAGWLLMAVGAWLLTEPDPSGIGEDRYGTSRKIIRVALIVGLVNTFLEFVQQATTFPPDLRRVLMVLGGLAGLVGLVGQFAQLNYLSKLAARIPDRTLEQRARFLMWAIGISYGLLIVGGLVVGLIATAGGGPGAGGGAGGAMMGLGCMIGIVGLAMLVFGIMYLLMLDKFRVRLGEQATLAEAGWARIEASPRPTAAGAAPGAAAQAEPQAAPGAAPGDGTPSAG